MSIQNACPETAAGPALHEGELERQGVAGSWDSGQMEQPLTAQVPSTPGIGQAEEIQVHGAGAQRQDVRAVIAISANTLHQSYEGTPLRLGPPPG